MNIIQKITKSLCYSILNYINKKDKLANMNRVGKNRRVKMVSSIPVIGGSVPIVKGAVGSDKPSNVQGAIQSTK